MLRFQNFTIGLLLSVPDVNNALFGVCTPKIKYRCRVEIPIDFTNSQNNYKLSEGVTMRGSIENFYPRTIFLKTDILDIRTVAKGYLSISIDKFK